MKQSLVQGSVVVLELDGTLVYVESVEKTKALVVALPEQPATRKDTPVFTPGKVGPKAISPFAGGTETAITTLSDRNKNFIGNYEKLRTEHGWQHVDRTPEEEAAMTVTKISGKKKKKTDEDPAVKPAKVKKEKKVKGAKTDMRFKLDDSKTLDQACTQKDKFKEGNRGHKVWSALKECGGEATVTEVAAKAAEKHDADWCSDPETIVWRALRELAKPEYGAVTSVVA